jgi:hypothetical protein
MARTASVVEAPRVGRSARSGLIRRAGHVPRRMSAFINESRAPGHPRRATVSTATGH